MSTFSTSQSPLRLLLPDSFFRFLDERGKEYGCMLSGALFGAAWWFWVDAVSTSANKIPFIQFLPGLFATIAILMINLTSQGELYSYSSMDDSADCRAKFWLLLSYLVSFGSVVAAVLVLVKDYAQADRTVVPSVWPGVACVVQTLLILGSGLALFQARSQEEGLAL